MRDYGPKVKDQFFFNQKEYRYLEDGRVQGYRNYPGGRSHWYDIDLGGKIIKKLNAEYKRREQEKNDSRKRQEVPSQERLEDGGN